jgi:Essential protein Yae1, N terminal
MDEEWTADGVEATEEQFCPSEHIAERLHKEGYRAGRAQGSERVLQEGFDEGFEAGFSAARTLGKLYSSACQTLDEAGLRRVEQIILVDIPERGCVLPEDFNTLRSLLLSSHGANIHAESSGPCASENSPSPAPDAAGDEGTTPR